MSQAYKCDGCGSYRDGDPEATLTVHGVATGKQHGSSDETLRELDLCDDCLNSVDKTLA